MASRVSCPPETVGHAGVTSANDRIERARARLPAAERGAVRIRASAYRVKLREKRPGAAGTRHAIATARLTRASQPL